MGKVEGNIDELCPVLEDIGKRDVLLAVIERANLFPAKRSDGCRVKNIILNFLYLSASMR